MEAVPLSERSAIGTAHPSVLGQLVRLLLRTLIGYLWWPASLWSGVEWIDLFGAESKLRKPIASFFRAWGVVFALRHAYHQRRR